MQIIKYQDLSDAKTIVEVESGKAIREVLPVLNWDNCKIFVNGVESNPDYVLKDTDIVLIRSVPHLTGLGILAGAVLIGVSVYAGIQAYKANKEAQEAKKAMEKLSNSSSSTSSSSDIATLPYLKGANNSLATGNTQPYFIGRRLMTPYILNGGKVSRSTKGFSEIGGTDGVDQYLNLLLEMGFNNLVIKSVFTDDIKLLNNVNLTANGKTYFTNSVFATSDSYMELNQTGADFSTTGFNQKCVEQQLSDELKKSDDDDYEDLYYTLENNAMSADVCILFNGLCSYNSSGTKENATRHVVPYYSYNYADVANGLSTESVVWHSFNFTGRKWVPPTTVTESGVLLYTDAYYKGSSYDDKREKRVLKNIASWVLSTGTDLRSSYDSYTIWYEWLESVSSSNRNSIWRYRAHIHLHKTTYTAGYWATNVPTTEFTNNVASQIRYNAHADFSFSDMFVYSTTAGKWVRRYYNPITIKLVCTDTTPTSGTYYDDCYVRWVQSWCFDEDSTATGGSFVKEKPVTSAEGALSTILGFHLKSTTANEDKLSSIQVIASGVAKTWDGTSWSSTKTETSNPASWLLEILTSDKHPASQIDESEIDLASFGEWYEYCDDNGLFVNYVLTQGMVKSAIIDMLLTIGHATMYKSIYGLKAIGIDCAKDNAIAVLNEQNLVSFSYDKDLTRQPDGVIIKYVDESADYQEDSIVVMYPGKTRSTDSVLTEISVEGITSYDQAYAHALYIMRCAKLRPKEVKAVVGEEGVYYAPMSKVLVQHPSLKIGLGSAEIKSVVTDSNGAITGLVLYDALDMDESNTFNVVIQCVSDSYCTPLSAQIVSYDGRTKEITFYTSISADATVIPHAGDILSYGYGVDTVTSPMLISAIERADKGYTLTLVDYNEDIFRTDDTIPDYTPNITEPRKPVEESPNDITVTPDVFFANYSNLYNSHIITLYKDSATKLTETGITSALVYKFSDNTITWADSDGSNGWSLTYPTTVTGTVYITTATAFGKSVSDTISADEWATPIASGQNGVNGYSTRSISLYLRQTAEPSSEQMPGTLSYNFETGKLSGDYGAWSVGIPAVSDTGVVWEMHATALTTGTTDEIEPSEWSDPVQITVDGVTADNIKQVLDANPQLLAGDPVVYCDLTSAGFAVDDTGCLIMSQSIDINFDVRQTGESLDFAFGTIVLPEGFSYSINYHTVTITGAVGSKFSTGTAKIPLIYREYQTNIVYANDDNGDSLYTDEDGKNYGYYIYKDDSVTYNYNIAMIGVKGGSYLGAVDSLDDIPSTDDLILGDYFVWTGSDTATDIVASGQLKQTAAYCYIGGSSYVWALDESAVHTATALSDILSVADADLQTNNSTAYEYLDHLTANSVFVDRLVANSAFIDKLFSEQITITDTGFIQSEGFISGEDGAGFRLSGDGQFECTDGIFRGSIQSGPLTLTKMDKTYEFIFDLSMEKTDAARLLSIKMDSLADLTLTEVDGTVTKDSTDYAIVSMVFGSWENLSDADTSTQTRIKNITGYGPTGYETKYCMFYMKYYIGTYLYSGQFINLKYFVPPYGWYNLGIWSYSRDTTGFDFKLTATGKMLLKDLPLTVSDDDDTGTIYISDGYLKVKQ